MVEKAIKLTVCVNYMYANTLAVKYALKVLTFKNPRIGALKFVYSLNVFLTSS